MKEVVTVCPYCGTGCTLKLRVEKGRITKVLPNDGPEAVNKGKLCSKGHFGFDFIGHQDRLKTPLIRKHGKLQPAGWTEALALVAGKLQEAKREHGPDSIAAFSSARCTNEENYLMQKVMRAAIGTNNIDHCARL